jgi:hypothetical protein
MSTDFLESRQDLDELHQQLVPYQGLSKVNYQPQNGHQSPYPMCRPSSHYQNGVLAVGILTRTQMLIAGYRLLKRTRDRISTLASNLSL